MKIHTPAALVVVFAVFGLLMAAFITSTSMAATGGPPTPLSSSPTFQPTAQPTYTLPPLSNGVRHFDRPQQPIQPTATPMSNEPVPTPTSLPPYPGPATEEPSALPTEVAPIATADAITALPEGKTSTALGTVGIAATGGTTIYLPIVMKNILIPVKVFAVAYVDISGTYDIDGWHNQLMTELENGSKWHGTAPAAFDYSTYNNSVTRVFSAPPLRADNGLFDYNRLYQDFNLCAKIQAGDVTEVWVWESGSARAAEFVVNGNTWNAIPAGYSVPNCGRTVATFNFRYNTPVDNALHSYGHRVEDAFLRFNVSGASTCDFITNTGPAPSKVSGSISDPNCTGVRNPSDTFGFIARPMTTNSNISVCGDVHFPPNIVGPWSSANEYIYNRTTAVSSRCLNWQWGGSQTVQISCGNWGCTERNYHVWWMQQIPGNGNNYADRNGGAARPVWWEYLWK